jgi:hypothetical protein
VVNNTTLFLQVPGSNPCHGKLFLQHFVTYAYTWNPGTIYDDLEHSIFEKTLTCGTQLNFMATWNTPFQNNAYMWDQSWFMTPLTWRKCLHVGPWKILWRLGTLYFWKKCLHVGPYWILWRLGALCFKIMLTCGTDVGLWRFFRAYGVTTQHGIGTLGYSTSRNDENFLSLNLLGSEILW